MPLVSTAGIQNHFFAEIISMEKNRIIAFLSLLTSLIGPATLIFLYVQALICPQGQASFIFRAGMAIYIVEFLSIHSSGFLLEDNKVKQKQQQKKKKFNRLFLFVFYTIFIFGFMLKLNCWFIGLYFLLSLCAKLFMSRSVEDDINKPQIAFSCINLVGCTFIVVMLASSLKRAFPIPESIISQGIKGTSGLFVEIPQTLLVWGILYFFFTAVFNITMFFKHTPRAKETA